ncbi:MAG: hypothetical protein A2Y69_00915 [Candidatus Aminicenantes bacterium RBG_13_59_9]|nr:MAG: hypothetical protein A2Y69_00915 [Candidatus Aminicenantes bacterium RBG_13_59_9]
MKRFSATAVFVFLCLGFTLPLLAQFMPEEVAERSKWEEFLLNANVVQEKQITSEAVTNPWRITLELNGVTNDALWKNPEGRMKGYLEGWKFEIAAYLFDKHLGLNMVPPTVEKRLHNNRGSCQIWVEAKMTMKDKVEGKIKTPPIKVFYYNRALNLQRFFDNLIGNEDRHQNNYLITEDWRIVLIDHSRSFRTGKKWTTELPYGEKNKEGLVLKEMPKDLFEKTKALTFEEIKGFTGDNLNDEEINAVLARRDLIVEYINKLAEKNGEANVLY